VLLATVLSAIWSHIWPQTIPASYKLNGGGAFLAASMQAPLCSVVLVLELTRHFDLLMAPTLVAVTLATVIARRLGAPSIYSARLRPASYTGVLPIDAATVEALDAGDDALPPRDQDEVSWPDDEQGSPAHDHHSGRSRASDSDARRATDHEQLHVRGRKPPVPPDK
jgi:Voltage gated chloride channel